jgi:hypothetical protein
VVDHGRERGEPGAVHAEVEATEGVDGRGHEALDVCLDRHVTGHAGAPLAELLDGGVEQVGVAVAQHDRRAVRQVRLGDGAPDPRRSAGDDRDPSLEPLTAAVAIS